MQKSGYQNWFPNTQKREEMSMRLNFWSKAIRLALNWSEVFQNEKIYDKKFQLWSFNVNF